MSFSQAWDAGFKALLLYVGTVFAWLIAIERHLSDLALSEALMNVTGLALGLGFFLRRRARVRAEAASAAAAVAALMEEI